MLSERHHRGTVDLTRLAARWQLLEDLYQAARTVIASRPTHLLDARMIDEGQVAGHRVYMLAERYLGVAWDNHSAFVSLLQSPHGLSPSAPWNLLRPTFEAAFYAAWVLDPDDSLERRRRALRVEWLDEIDHRNYDDEVRRMRATLDSDELRQLEGDLAAQRQRNEASYRSDAEALGIAFPPRKVQVRDELGNLSHCSQIADTDALLRVMWRGLSGVQHGRMSAMLRGSDKDDLYEVSGGVHAVLSVNDEAFFAAADVTLNMHMEAVALLMKRNRAHDASGSSSAGR